MAAASPLSDADLHGLVDGHIDADRRADVLRRAAASPRDRMLIERWQDQADMIRAAFAGVEHEPLPSRLDLRTSPKLHAVPLAAKPLAAKPASAKSASSKSASPKSASPKPASPKPAFAGPISSKPSAAATISGRNGRRRLATAATLAAMAVGLAGSWYVAGSPAAGVEHELAGRTTAALAPDDPEASPPEAGAEAPPTTAVPDLSAAGFTLTGAEVRGTSPRSLIFRYSNARDERVAVGTSRTDGDDSAPVPHGSGVTWRSRRVAYALSGTMTRERLGAIAASLQADAPRNR